MKVNIYNKRKKTIGIVLLLALHSLIFTFITVSCKEDERPINIKVIPSRTNKLTIEDLDQLKMEILHDLNSQIRGMEDTMADNERLKEKTSSNWARNGSPIYMPRNPIAYFKTNLMQTLKSSLNDSQNNVVYPIDVQKKIDEVYKRLQAPNNHINIHYNAGNAMEENSMLRRLVKKLSSANEAISNLKKLNSNNSNNNLDKVREIGDKELQVIKSVVDNSLKDPNIAGNNKISFKQKEETMPISNENKKEVEFDIQKVLSDLKSNNNKLKEIDSNQNVTISDLGFNKNSIEKLKRDKRIFGAKVNKFDSDNMLNEINEFTNKLRKLNKLEETTTSASNKNAERSNKKLLTENTSNSETVKMIHNEFEYNNKDLLLQNNEELKKSIVSNTQKLKQFLNKKKQNKVLKQNSNNDVPNFGISKENIKSIDNNVKNKNDVSNEISSETILNEKVGKVNDNNKEDKEVTYDFNGPINI